MKKENQTMGYVLNKDQQRLVEENWEFAAGVARRYAGGCVPMADLESEAWTALCYAAFKYKKVEGCKFTSYAYYFIKASIMRLLKSENWRQTVETCKVVEALAEDDSPDEEMADGDDKRRARLDELMAKLTPRERKVVRRIYAIGCEETSVRELAQEMGLSEVRVRQILTKGVNKLQIMSNL